MTRYYYQWQTDSILEGTTEELRRYHMDYPPGDTQQEALVNAMTYFTNQRSYYSSIALYMYGKLKKADQRLGKLLQETP